MSGKQEIIKSMIGGRHDILIIGQKTNADRIRSMTDEELAELFLAHDEQLYRHCPSDKRAEDCYADFGKAFDACEKCWLGWLKAPVEEVQDG